MVFRYPPPDLPVPELALIISQNFAHLEAGIVLILRLFASRRSFCPSSLLLVLFWCFFGHMMSCYLKKLVNACVDCAFSVKNWKEDYGLHGVWGCHAYQGACGKQVIPEHNDAQRIEWYAYLVDPPRTTYWSKTRRLKSADQISIGKVDW